jgi:3-hydroxyacyl-CoA dehydrogenase
LLEGRSPDDVLARISIAEELADAVADAEHVQESAPERLEVKIELFARLDSLAPPEAVLASSSSAILPSKFTETLAGRHRCLVAHPINPPYLVPATEVVPAPWTSPEAVERTRELLVSAGQAPIVMKRELDGFVMNRMQGALLEEAFRLVADGYATVEDIDVGIREGLALRWSFMGPFETIDLNAPGGVRDYVERYQHIYVHLFKQMQRRVDWAGEVLETLEQERRSRLPRSGFADRLMWRDRRLMALAAHKRRAAKEIGE